MTKKTILAQQYIALFRAISHIKTLSTRTKRTDQEAEHKAHIFIQNRTATTMPKRTT